MMHCIALPNVPEDSLICVKLYKQLSNNDWHLILFDLKYDMKICQLRFTVSVFTLPMMTDLFSFTLRAQTNF